MKTPRELLFEKHQGATPALDAVRRKALERAFPCPPVANNLLGAVVLKLWRELVWPSRRIWAGLAVAWLAVLGFNLAASLDSVPMYADVKPISVERMMALQAQRQEMAKLIQSFATEASEPPRQTPRPRSELQTHFPIV